MANKYERMIIVASHQGNAVYTILCTSNLQRQKEKTHQVMCGNRHSYSVAKIINYTSL